MPIFEKDEKGQVISIRFDSENEAYCWTVFNRQTNDTMTGIHAQNAPELLALFQLQDELKFQFHLERSKKSGRI